MPVIQFNASDAMSTVIVEAGTYEAEIVKIDAKPSKEGKSINYWVDFGITQKGKYESKVLSVCLNTLSNSPSLLGTMQFYPHSYFLIIDAAIKNAKVEAVDKNIDTDELLHKPLSITVGIQTVEGALINTITAFLPVGAAKTAAAGPGW